MAFWKDDPSTITLMDTENLSRAERYLSATAGSNGDFYVDIDGADELDTNDILHIAFPSADDNTKNARLSIDGSGGTYKNIKDSSGTQLLGSDIENKEFSIKYDGTDWITYDLYLDGVTSAIQTQLNAKLPLVGGTLTGELKGTLFTANSYRTQNDSDAIYEFEDAGGNRKGYVGYIVSGASDGIAIQNQTSGKTLQILDNGSFTYDSKNISYGRSILTAYYSAGSNYAIVANDTVEQYPLNASTSIGDKLTLDSNTIVIGSGVTKILVNANVAFVPGVVSNKNVYIYNDSTNAQSCFTYGANTGVFHQVPLTPALLTVEEGDAISLRVYGKIGDAIQRNTATFITVEVVE